MIEMDAEAGVCPAALGNMSATTPNGTVTSTWPRILRQPVRPRLR